MQMTSSMTKIDFIRHQNIVQIFFKNYMIVNNQKIHIKQDFYFNSQKFQRRLPSLESLMIVFLANLEAVQLPLRTRHA